MAYDIRMVKLVSSETALGKYNKDTNCIEDPAILQTIPTQQGVQMMLMPFGYPFDSDFAGSISFDHVMFTFKNVPEDLKTKYLEGCSKLSLSSGGLGNMDLKGEAAAASASGLLLGK